MLKGLLRRVGGVTPLAFAALFAVACAPAATPPRSVSPNPAATLAPAPAAATAPVVRPGAGPEDRPGFDEKAVADFYRGKTVRMLVGTAAGGSYDLVTRLIARHIGKHIPGSPAVIVENMPGANNLVAANYMYKVGPKDGTLIQSFVGSLIVRQLFGAPGVEFDAAKLHYLGAPATDSYVLVVAKKSGFTRVEETFGPNGRPLVLGTLGPGSPLEVGPSLLRDAFAANIKLVSGYDGGSKIRLAVDSGEVDGTFTSWQDSKGPSRDKLDSGEWVILSQASAEPIPELPNVPSFLDLARNDEQRQLFRMATIVPYQFARPYVLAPETPQDRVQALETAFTKTMADAEFLAEAEKGQYIIAPVSAGRIRQLIDEFLAMPQSLREKLQPIMLPV